MNRGVLEFVVDEPLVVVVSFSLRTVEPNLLMNVFYWEITVLLFGSREVNDLGLSSVVTGDGTPFL